MSQSTSRFSLILRNCARLNAVVQARQAHAQILIHGLIPHLTLVTDLLLVYCKCGVLHDARKVFDKMTQRNMHSWNILIASYVHSSLHFDAINVFNEFRGLGFLPDHYTLPQMFKVSVGIGDVYMGKRLHCWTIKLGFEVYVVVASTVLDFYAKYGVVGDAKKVFDNMILKDTISWNSMISGYGRAGLYGDALDCFTRMLFEGGKMDIMTIPSVLNACGGEGDLRKGKEIHCLVLKSQFFVADVAIENSLIDMYSKCGTLLDAENVFRNMCSMNVVTWTTMISCYGAHGKGEKSLALFNKMKDCGIQPNSVTLTAILASCSHAGYINEGWRIFKSFVSDYEVEPTVEHYACVVDLLSRFGFLQEAFMLIINMKHTAAASVWGALLSGCMMHKNIEIGEIAANRLFKLEPKNPSNFIALIGIYESLGMSHGVSLTREKMRELGLTKLPGCSWITIEGVVHKFYGGDKSHPLGLRIFETLSAVKQASVNCETT
ncbi:Pentatricopeptide repeat-containing protein, mitochondrial, partial [Cucurbita argyrosperma subsp. sororia]